MVEKATYYDFAISHVFKKYIDRALIIIAICLFFILFFSYYVFTANAWRISLFGLSISTYYLPPVIALTLVLHEEFMVVKKYGIKSFKKIGVIDNTLIGKNFINQAIYMKNPVVVDWDFHIKKTWYFSKNSDVFNVSFIKLKSGDNILYVPHSKTDNNFIQRLKEISCN